MEKFKVNLTVKKGNRTKPVSFFANAGQTLLEAIEKNVKKTKVKKGKLGPELVKILGLKKSKKSGVEFRIDGKIPYCDFKGTGKKLYLSLYHIKILQNINLQIELVSVNCDFANSEVDPILDFRTGKFDLEKLPGKAKEKPLYKAPQPVPEYRVTETIRMNYLHFWLLKKAKQFDGISKKPWFKEPDFGFEIKFWQNSAKQNMQTTQPEPQLQKENETMQVFAPHLMQEPIVYGPEEQLQEPEQHKTQEQAQIPEPEQEQPEQVQEEQQVLQMPPQKAKSYKAGKMHRKKNKQKHRKTKITRKPITGAKVSYGQKKQSVPLSSIKRLKAVIFDLDGVIVNSEKPHLKTFNQLLAPLGIKIDAKTWKRNYTGIGSFAIVKDIFRRNRISGNIGQWVEKRKEIYQKHIEKNGLRPIAGFLQTYRLLRKNKVKVMVASGGHKSHVKESLRSIGLPRVLFVGIEDVKKRKPAPDLFLLAAKRLKTKPSACLVFEDSFAGIQAASNASMPCIALSTTMTRTKLRKKATLIVNNFKSKKLKKLLLRLAKREKTKRKKPKKKRLLKGKGRTKKRKKRSAKGR